MLDKQILRNELEVAGLEIKMAEKTGDPKLIKDAKRNKEEVELRLTEKNMVLKVFEQSQEK